MIYIEKFTKYLYISSVTLNSRLGNQRKTLVSMYKLKNLLSLNFGCGFQQEKKRDFCFSFVFVKVLFVFFLYLSFFFCFLDKKTRILTRYSFIAGLLK